MNCPKCNQPCFFEELPDIRTCIVMQSWRCLAHGTVIYPQLDVNQKRMYNTRRNSITNTFKKFITKERNT